MKELILKVTASKENYYLSILSDLLVAMLFLTLALKNSTSIAPMLALFIVGVIFFTFLEYAVHAWLFHKNHIAKVFIEGHKHHHQNPFSFDAMPFFMSFVIAFLLFFILQLFMDKSSAYALVGGITMGYFNYGIMHHIMHRREFLSPYWRYMQEFHFVHHKHQDKNMGITTDIWDRIFGTYYQWNEADLKGIDKLKKIKSKS